MFIETLMFYILFITDIVLMGVSFSINNMWGMIASIIIFIIAFYYYCSKIYRIAFTNGKLQGDLEEFKKALEGESDKESNDWARLIENKAFGELKINLNELGIYKEELNDFINFLNEKISEKLETLKEARENNFNNKKEGVSNDMDEMER
jgi:hypothetical protein